MEEGQIPNWVRGLDIVVGIISVFAAVLIILGSSFARIVLIFVLSFSILAIGVARIVRAGALEMKGLLRRTVNLLGGIVAMIIVGVIILTPEMPEILMIQLISLAWIVLGMVRLAIGFLETEVDMRMRAMQICVGLASVVIAFVIELAPSIDVALAMLFLGSIVGVNGLARAARGYSGI